MDFEKAFEMFLDRREYDRAENALFSMVRIAFLAGWLSANGAPPMPHKVIELKHKNVLKLDNEIDSELNNILNIGKKKEQL